MFLLAIFLIKRRKNPYSLNPVKYVADHVCMHVFVGKLSFCLSMSPRLGLIFSNCLQSRRDDGKKGKFQKKLCRRRFVVKQHEKSKKNNSGRQKGAGTTDGFS